MAVADRTFSFRAPSALRERVAHAERAYRRLAEDPAVAAHLSRELEIRLQRRLRETSGRGENQGATLRAVVEAFVDATEAADGEAQLIDELRAFDAADTAGASERAGLLDASLDDSA